MKLYDAMTPNSLRVKVFLAEKGIDVARAPVDIMGGGTRTPAFMAINSLGELPVLKLDDGCILTESVAICRYLEALHPTPPLFGRDAFEQAQVEMWNRRMELHLFSSVGDYVRHSIPFFADKVTQIPVYAESQKARFATVWRWLDKELSDCRTFVAGDAFSVADITGMAALMVRDLFDVATPDGCANAARWERAMRDRASFTTQLPKAA